MDEIQQDVYADRRLLIKDVTLIVRSSGKPSSVRTPIPVPQDQIDAVRLRLSKISGIELIDALVKMRDLDGGVRLGL